MNSVLAACGRFLRLASIFVVLLIGSSAFAQLPTATISGVVRDSSGAVIPAANLAVRNIETGLSRTSKSGSDGSYRFPALPVGSYEIRVEQAGFQTQIRSGLTLTVSQEAVVNFTLAVGAIEQTVAVTAEAPLVNTSSGSLGGLVDEKKVADLPLNGRNYIDLTLLQTGIQHQGNRPRGEYGVWFSSNGAPTRSNSYLLDGARMIQGGGATSASTSGTTLGVEGIREFRVVTNSFSAEYGMTMGAQVVIVSKSGTNAFHGSLFEYLRNSALDARNFFDYTTATTPGRLPPFKRNNFGASFGGPIKKDKTFFFGVYEGVRQRKGLSIVANVIPPAAKVDGGLVPQIAPVIKPFLAEWPEPNLPNNQYTTPFSQPQTEDYWQVRVDQIVSAADTAFVRYTFDDNVFLAPRPLPRFTETQPSRMQFATLSENHVFSPVLLNTFSFSYSRTRNATPSNPAGLVGPQFSFVPGQEAGAINVGGLTVWGPGVSPVALKQNIFTWSDDMFYTRGRHALKFGALINRYQLYGMTAPSSLGQINFANLTQFLLAQPSSYIAATPGSIFDATWHYSTLGFYVQDDLRVRSNLTLNIGLRYEFNTTFQDTQGRRTSFRHVETDAAPTVGPLFTNSSLRNFSPRFGFAWDVRGNGRTAIRGGFGLLYDIGNLGGALIQIACSPPFCSSSTFRNPPPLTLPLFFPPEVAGKSLAGIDYSLQQPHILQYNLTVERQLPWDMVATLGYAGSRGINLMQHTDGNPTVPQILPDGRPFWNGNEPRINPNWSYYELHTASGNSWYNSLQFGLLKRVSKGLQFQSAYTFSKTLDEGSNQQIDNTANSIILSYPSNIKLERGLASFDATHNWRFNTIYRFPELADKGGVLGNLLNGWGMSGILSLQTGLPFTVHLQTQRSRSGVQGGGNQRGLGASTDRPDLVPGIKFSSITTGVSRGCTGIPAGTPVGTPNRWYDPCAFTLQPAGFLGTAGRAILRGPGLANLDFSVTKDTPLRFLGEGGRLQFRAEIFNILNRPNFGGPLLGASTGNRAGIVFAGTGSVGIPLATAGVLNDTNTTSRQLQFSLKILF